MPGDEFFVEPRAFIGKRADLDLDARGTQMIETAARNERIRVLDRANDAADSGVYQRLGARRCFTVVVVRFERNIRSAAAGTLPGLLKCDGLRVNHAVERVCALTDNLAVRRNNDAADERIGADEPASGRGQFESTP